MLTRSYKDIALTNIGDRSNTFYSMSDTQIKFKSFRQSDSYLSYATFKWDALNSYLQTSDDPDIKYFKNVKLYQMRGDGLYHKRKLAFRSNYLKLNGKVIKTLIIPVTTHNENLDFKIQILKLNGEYYIDACEICPIYIISTYSGLFKLAHLSAEKYYFDLLIECKIYNVKDNEKNAIKEYENSQKFNVKLKNDVKNLLQEYNLPLVFDYKVQYIHNFDDPVGCGLMRNTYLDDLITFIESSNNEYMKFFNKERLYQICNEDASSDEELGCFNYSKDFLYENGKIIKEITIPNSNNSSDPDYGFRIIKLNDHYYIDTQLAVTHLISTYAGLVNLVELSYQRALLNKVNNVMR